MKQDVVLPITPKNALTIANKLIHAVDKTDDPADLHEIETKLDAVEAFMRKAGIFPFAKQWPANKARMLALWKLGQALADIAPGRGPGRGKKVPGERELLLRQIKLASQRVTELERIGAMPKALLFQLLNRLEAEERLARSSDLMAASRPYWRMAQRRERHKEIYEAAKEMALDDQLGPFPLIYADPPWRFEAYSELGKEYSPDAHYPTLEYTEIKNVMVSGRSMQQLAHEQAALFLWCTSSNIPFAIDVMQAWGFQFKTSAAWDKQRTGTGYVWLNQHEILLYGTKGNMPAPLAIFPSLFSFPRGKHSAKPKEVREMLDRMYPEFDGLTKIELFCRDEVPGWTTWGYEA